MDSFAQIFALQAQQRHDDAKDQPSKESPAVHSTCVLHGYLHRDGYPCLDGIMLDRAADVLTPRGRPAQGSSFTRTNPLKPWRSHP